MQYVIKKNSDVVPFDEIKIINAIKKAKNNCGSTIGESIINQIANEIRKNEENLTTEEIQDLVVDELMNYDKNLAKSYQSYRAIRHEKRKNGESIIYEINGMVEKTSEKLTENANKDHRTISVQRDILAGISSKEYYLNYILPKHIAQAHKSFALHIHDMDYLLFKETNCELVNLGNMLKDGCKIGNANMYEPNSIEVAVGHTVQIIASVSSNTYGGCSIPYLDKVLVPYVRKTFVKHFNNGLKFLEGITEKEFFEKDIYFNENWKDIYIKLEEKSLKAYLYAKELTIESVKQSMQGLEYEVNSLSTVNGQTPFTTIGIGTETSWEGKLIQEMIFKNRMAGFGKNKKDTAIFPKIAYAVCEGHNFKEDDINWDITKLAMECMTKAIYPDILFVTLEQISNETVVYPMGCRAFLSPWYNENGKETYIGRFNIGATSINLPRIAIKHKGDEKGFYKELDEVLDLCRENSIFRAKYLENTPAEMAPIIWMDGALANKSRKETVKDLIWGGYSTVSIGYIGLSEVSQLLYGIDFSQNEEVYEKTFNILSYMKSKLDYWKKEDNLGYALYSTPSESLCGRFAEGDFNEFGAIEGITDKGYYDNSFHVSSRIAIDPFLKMKLEGKAHKIATGGHISYIEAPNLGDNIPAIYDILKYAQSVGIHYFGINQPLDKCYICDFEGEFLATENGFTCPKCGNKNSDLMSVIRRVCGYLTQSNSRPFNKGKQKEVIARFKHLKID